MKPECSYDSTIVNFCGHLPFEVIAATHLKSKGQHKNSVGRGERAGDSLERYFKRSKKSNKYVISYLTNCNKLSLPSTIEIKKKVVLYKIPYLT